jgi:imidazolonepropionase-like amidohydrolase
MEPKWVPAATLPAAVLSAQLREMLGRYGFAYAVDTGSDLANTVALRKRIEAGEVDGPVIFTAGSVFVPPDGQPAYLDFRLPELASPEQAREMIAANFEGGADAVKLMTVPATARRPHPAMDIEVVRAATAEAHRRGKLAFAHPTNETGLRLAVDGGVDVVLHTAFESGPWSPDLVADMVRHNVALTPTIKLWKYEASKTGGDWWVEGRALSIGQLKAFSAAGGIVLFGTDVGYMTDYDPTDEYVAMAEAGLSAGRILVSLTTAPATRFGRADRTGRLAPGMDADLVILDGDPAADITSFARVRRLYRAGKLIHGGG